MTTLDFTITRKVTLRGVTYEPGDETALGSAASDNDIYMLQSLGYCDVDPVSVPATSESRTDVLDEGTTIRAEAGALNFVGVGVEATEDEDHPGRVIVSIMDGDPDEGQVFIADGEGGGAWGDLAGTPDITPTDDEGKLLGVVSDAPAWTTRVGSKIAFSKTTPPASGTSAFSWVPDYSASGVTNTAELGGPGTVVIGNPRGARFPNDINMRALVIVSDGPNEDSAGIRSYMYRDSATFSGGVLCKKARGSIGTPAAVQANDVLGCLQGMAYHGDDTLNGGWSANIAAVKLLAAENQTKTAAGTQMDIELTRIGAASKRLHTRFQADGSMKISDYLDAPATPTAASVFYSKSGKPAMKGSAEGVEFLFDQQSHIADPSADAASCATAIASILDALEAFGFLAAS